MNVIFILNPALLAKLFTSPVLTAALNIGTAAATATLFPLN